MGTVKMFDIYVKYSVQAENEDEALDKWDEGKAVFQEFEDIVEVF